MNKEAEPTNNEMAEIKIRKCWDMGFRPIRIFRSVMARYVTGMRQS